MTNVTCQKPGKPVAKLVPADWNIDDIYNFMAGKGAVAGDVVSQAVSDEEWGELSDSRKTLMIWHGWPLTKHSFLKKWSCH